MSPDMSSMVSNSLTVAGALLRPDSAPPPVSAPDYKFPIESYTGLQKANAERVAKFEAETKAMLTQRTGMAKSSQDIREAVVSSHHRHGEFFNKILQQEMVMEFLERCFINHWRQVKR